MSIIADTAATASPTILVLYRCAAIAQKGNPSTDPTPELKMRK